MRRALFCPKISLLFEEYKSVWLETTAKKHSVCCRCCSFTFVFWTFFFDCPRLINTRALPSVTGPQLGKMKEAAGTEGVAPAGGGQSGQSHMPSAVDGVNGIGRAYDYPEQTPEGPYRVLNQYHSQPRRLRVACVGAGASGLCLAYKMEKMLEAGTWELTLFDKNSHFGGTWLGRFVNEQRRELLAERMTYREHIPWSCVRYSGRMNSRMRPSGTMLTALVT